MTIRLYNTLTRKVEPLRTLQPGKVAMYHCGPTVYSSPHIGNFRSFLVADLLRRFFEDRGLDVLQVMNITDVGHMTQDDEDAGEDKLEKAAREQKKDPWQIARHYEAEFFECQKALHVRIPHHMPRATDFIEQMGAIIGDLLDKGYAYQVGGDVYFSIERFPDYGKLSGKVLEELEEGARVAVNEDKRDPRDFALWKTDPKHIMQWDPPFPGGARGFPGWHIECSAMAMHYLGQSIDIHTGGEDNLFPHHECEVAQSEAHTGRPFVRHWLHVRHLLVDGTKMSKSLGNFFTVRELLEKGYSGLELRYALIRVQYRQTLNFTLQCMEEARAAIRRVQGARQRLVRLREVLEPAGSDDLGGAVEQAQAAFTEAMADDLNTSEALAAVFALVTASNRATPSAESAAAALQAFARFEDVLACFGSEPAAAAAGAPSEVQGLLAKRQAAREQKDFAAADALRDEIQAAGWKIVDTPQGPRLEPAGG